MTRQLPKDARDIRVLLSIKEGLSDRELAFIEDAAQQVLDNSVILSTKRRQKLEEILLSHDL